MSNELKYVDISTMNPNPGDYIIAYYERYDMDVMEMSRMHTTLCNAFPNNTVISIPMPDMYLEDMTKNEAAAMLLKLLQDVAYNQRDYIEILRDELDRVDGDDLR